MRQDQSFHGFEIFIIVASILATIGVGVILYRDIDRGQTEDITAGSLAAEDRAAQPPVATDYYAPKD